MMMTPWVPLDKFVLFGDSITEYMADQFNRGPSTNFVFKAKLDDDYMRRLDVIIRGFSGYTTDQALKMIPRQIWPPSSGRIRMITVFFGANDSCLPGERQHVPIERFKSNLTAVLTHPLIRAHGAKIFLITVPPFYERAWDGSPRTAENTAEYSCVSREVGLATEGVIVVDIWTALMKKLGWTDGCGKPLPGSKADGVNTEMHKYLPDGVHLSHEAYKVLYEELIKAIREQAPEELPENLDINAQQWFDALDDK